MRSFYEVVRSPTADGHEEGTNGNPGCSVHSGCYETVNKFELEEDGMKIEPMLSFPMIFRCNISKRSRTFI